MPDAPLFARLLAAHCAARGWPAPVPEHRFHPVRKWRFDFAWPAEKVALEIEGGAYTRGRHTRPGGYAGDCQKYSEAALLGWVVLRVTWEQAAAGLAFDYLDRAFDQAEQPP